MSYRAPIDDILFQLIHVAPAPGAPPGSADIANEWRSILDQYAAFVEDVILPLDRPGDIEGATFENGAVRTPNGWPGAYARWAQAGWNGVSLPPAYGGSGLPITIGTATMEMLASACAAFSTLPVLTQGAVAALETHASPDLCRAYLPQLVAGTWTATMNLTEPQAGSDLALLTTRAETAADGSYRLFGQKIFITFGEHDAAENIVHLVLARLPDAPAGTRGISLFLVPKLLPSADGRPGQRNDLRCAGIEHKLGIRGSPTCTMIYGENDGAVGWLVGAPHQGLACMFTMMNRARLATGLQGVAVAERATQQALAYAKERRQGRAAGYSGPAPIVAHPDVRRMLGRMMALTTAIRAIGYFAAAAIEDAALSGDQAVRSRGECYADLLTPVFKAFATESGVEVASLAIQVHGGMGYIEESGAAQHWRDARIAPIYEGTNGIQAIDLATRKVRRDHGAGMSALIAECRAMLAQAAGPAAPPCDLPRVCAIVAAALDDLAAATEWLLAPARTDEDVLYAATPYLRLAGVALGASLLVKGAAAARRLAEAGGPKHDRERRESLAVLFADDVAVETGALLRTITAPTAASVAWKSVLDLDH